MKMSMEEEEEEEEEGLYLRAETRKRVQATRGDENLGGGKENTCAQGRPLAQNSIRRLDAFFS